jgi:hypothetical protein
MRKLSDISFAFIALFLVQHIALYDGWKRTAVAIGILFLATTFMISKFARKGKSRKRASGLNAGLDLADIV